MRQDIVEVLKTSKQNLVRALIGLPSVAAAQWRRVRTLLLATAIFKEEGRLRRKRSNKSNSLTRLKTGTLNGEYTKVLSVWLEERGGIVLETWAVQSVTPN